jgi:hypothetical protein
LTAGLVAGFASWGIGEVTHGRLAPPDLVNVASPSGGGLPASQVQKLEGAKRSAQMLDAALVFGSLGAALGLTLGWAGGSARRSARSAWKAAVVGFLLGGAAGGTSIGAVLPVYFRTFDPDKNELILGLVFHLLISAAAGAAGGAAFGVGLGDRRRGARAVLGGLLGAAAGALVYQVVGAIAFPLDGTSKPISATWVTRLFARLAVAILAAAGTAMGAFGQGPESISGPESQRREPDPAA